MTSDLESGTACALARRKKLQIKRKGKVATLGAYSYLMALLIVLFGCALATSAEIQKDKTYGTDQQQASPSSAIRPGKWRFLRLGSL